LQKQISALLPRMLKLGASKLFVLLVILINRIRQSDMLNLDTRAYTGRKKIHN